VRNRIFEVLRLGTPMGRLSKHVLAEKQIGAPSVKTLKG